MPIIEAAWGVTFCGGVGCLVIAAAQFASPSRTRYALMLAGAYFCVGIHLMILGLPAFYPERITLASFFCPMAICILCGHLFIPLIYLCFKTVVDETFEPGWRLLLFFMPGAIFSIGLIFYGAALPDMTGTVEELENYLGTRHSFYLIVPNISILASLLFCADVILTFRRRWKAQGVRRSEGRATAIACGFIFAANASWFVTYLLAFEAESTAVIQAVQAVFFVVLYVVSARGTKLFHFQPILDDRRRRTKRNGFDVAASLARLDAAMAEHKMYLNPDLTIKGLASSVGITPHQLSELINRNMGCNYVQYVNRCRIEDARRRLLEEDADTLLAIALDCGFNSSSAFYRTFKQHTGSTPKDFVRENKAETPSRLPKSNPFD